MPHAPRRHPAHGVKATRDGPVIVFVTVCTRGRKKWLASEDAHADVLLAWNAADGWMVGRYVVMPDHVHLFAAPRREDVTLDAWVRYWKGLVTRQRANAGERWQADHWDTRLRHWESYAARWEYVRNNPVRAGLATQADAWPFQGECHALEWW